jgi:hypothetical protein
VTLRSEIWWVDKQIFRLAPPARTGASTCTTP